jgi:hypothetical protein
VSRLASMRAPASHPLRLPRSKQSIKKGDLSSSPFIEVKARSINRRFDIITKQFGVGARVCKSFSSAGYCPSSYCLPSACIRCIHRAHFPGNALSTTNVFSGEYIPSNRTQHHPPRRDPHTYCSDPHPPPPEWWVIANRLVVHNGR